MDDEGEGEGENAVEDREDGDPGGLPCKYARGFRSGKTRPCSATAFEPQLNLLL